MLYNFPRRNIPLLNDGGVDPPVAHANRNPSHCRTRNQFREPPENTGDTLECGGKRQRHAVFGGDCGRGDSRSSPRRYLPRRCRRSFLALPPHSKVPRVSGSALTASIAADSHFLLSNRSADCAVPGAAGGTVKQTKNQKQKHNAMKTQTILIALALALPAGFAGAQAPDAPPPGRPPEGGPRQADRPPGDRLEGGPNVQRPQGRRDPAAPEGGPQRGPRPDGAPEGGPQQRGQRPEGAPGNPGGPDQGRPRFVPPIIAALDTNGDGEISAEEIANAPAALRKLDKNGDGKLTMEELLPMPPRGAQDGTPRNRDGEGARRQGGPRDGAPQPEGVRPRDGERGAANPGPRDGVRPEGGPRDGGPRPEGAPRRERPPGDAPRPEGERRPNPEG